MKRDNRIYLDGNWTLYHAPNMQVKNSLPNTPLTQELLSRLGYDSLPATVPGNFELDFLREGLIDEPFYSTNTIKLQKYENLHLFYAKSFVLDSISENTVLCFEGIDTIAHIYLNGKLVGQTDNMLIPFTFSGEALQRGENELLVHIIPSHIAARNYPLAAGCTHQQFGFDSLAIRKAPHSYGWDIMPRALSGGIWRSCYIEERPACRIDELFIWTHFLSEDYSHASLAFFWNLTVDEDFLTDYSLHFEGRCDESLFESTCPLYHTSGRHIVGIDTPQLWFPRGYGDAKLYDITVTLFKGKEPLYEYRTKTGIRLVTLTRTSITDNHGKGEFLFQINRQKVFWQGTNWVPVDAYHSRDKERLPNILPLLTECGCNCVRCWGGNVYEDDVFYDFCDENGIMVWQDFSHACGINPQDAQYAECFAKEAEAIVKRLRNHPSIMLWAGDNEVDLCYEWSSGHIARDPNGNILTRKVLPYVLASHDFTRPYLPSSPYIDSTAYEVAQQGLGCPVSEHHLWGPRDYFKGEYYSSSVCHFASETGYHGCPSPESLKKYIRPEELWPWQKYPQDPSKSKIAKDDWTCHAACSALDDKDVNYYRISLMSEQVKVLFSDFRGDEEAQGLWRFALASQISQAEAKKYFIERFRMTKWRRTGIIWWNLIDGWPQISDAVVDYYGTKKLAFHYIKASQSPICLMLDEPHNGKLELRCVSDLQESAELCYSIRDIDSGDLLASGDFTTEANSAVPVCKISAPESEKCFYLIEWKYRTTTKEGDGKNHYVTNIKDLQLDTYISWLKKAGMYNLLEGF